MRLQEPPRFPSVARLAACDPSVVHVVAIVVGRQEGVVERSSHRVDAAGFRLARGVGDDQALFDAGWPGSGRGARAVSIVPAGSR